MQVQQSSPDGAYVYSTILPYPDVPLLCQYFDSTRAVERLRWETLPPEVKILFMRELYQGDIS